MQAPDDTALLKALAEHLRSRRQDIADDWRERVGARAAVRPQQREETARLREIAPQLVDAIADRVAGTADSEWTLLATVRAATAERFELGYDVQELLKDVEMLGQAIFARASAFTDAPEIDLGRSWSAAARLSGVLSAIGTITAGTYRELDVERQRELARRIEVLGHTIAHELKNPLGSARGAAQLLQDELVSGDAEQRDRFLDMILRNIDRAHAIVDDIRSLSRLEIPEDEKPPRVPVPQIIESVIADLHTMAEQNEVEVRVSNELPDIAAPRGPLELALVNLVGNAIKYADPAKAERRVDIRASYDDGRERLRVEVSDNGLGIPEAAQVHVFKRFFRAHPDSAPGTGLGLAIAREAVERLAGEIGFHSEPGAGSTFHVLIPARVLATPSQGDAVAQ
ncbi:MAG: ATP-binding protein [Longimicrobiales bacterium]